MRLLLAGTLTLTLTLVSCSTDKEPAEETAEALAAALTRGTLPPELFQRGEPQTAYDGIVDGLGEATPAVEVTGVEERDDTATATLTWAWDLDGREWAYETSVELRYAEDEWLAAWSTALIEPSLKEGEVLDTTELAPRRGPIVGAGGTRIVTDRPVVRYGLDKTRTKPGQVASSARRIAELLEIDVRSYVRLARSAGDRAFVEALVLRRQDTGQVDPSFSDIPGAGALSDEMPLAPTREFAAPVIGRVGPVTAELVEESEGRLEAGDVVGLSGLQARYDEQLTGTPGIRVDAVTEDGASRTLYTADPVDGEPLRTTLDVELQLEAERILAVPDAEEPGPATALVALRPSDGAILVAANGPGSDGQNIATYGQFAPGSTFKLVSSLALLRSGLTPQSPLSCPPDVVVDGKRFENYDDYPASGLGDITLRAAVANSCNTAFIGARDRLDEGDLASAAETLGLGVDFDLGFPAYFGQVPPPESETEAAADLIGQGRVLASPMTMAAVAASVRAGRTVVPHLLADYQPAASPAVPLTDGEAASLRSLMRAVVTEGSGRFLAELPGEVGAKTGTAEYAEPGPDGSLPTHAWMVATRGDFAVAVFVETGESGSGTAGPLLERFLSFSGRR